MEPGNFQTFMEALLNRMERQDAQAATTNSLLLQLVDEVRNTRQDSQRFQQQQSLFNQRLLEWKDRQEKFNERQEKFNERQDQFNSMFLDEIRDMKRDIKELTEVVLKQHEGRPKCLEDFMDGFLRKAS